MMLFSRSLRVAPRFAAARSLNLDSIAANIDDDESTFLLRKHDIHLNMINC
jgi:hypothetical protein